MPGGNMVRHHNGFGPPAKPVVATWMVAVGGYGSVTDAGARWQRVVSFEPVPRSAVIARFNRAIQHAVTAVVNRAAAYWIPAFAGMTAAEAAPAGHANRTEDV